MSRISWSMRAEGYRQLAQLLRAGISLHASLDKLGGAAPWRELCADAASQIADGADVSTAFAQERPSIRALLAWADRSGHIDQGCDRIAAVAEKIIETRRKVIAKVAYPLLVLHLAVVVPAIPTVVQGGGAWKLLIGPIALWLTAAIAIVIVMFAKQQLVGTKPIGWLLAPWRDAMLAELLAAGATAGLLLDEWCERCAELMVFNAWKQGLEHSAKQIRHHNAEPDDLLWRTTGFTETAAGRLVVGYQSGQLAESANAVAKLAAEQALDRLNWIVKIASGVFYATAVIATIIAVISVFAQVYGPVLKELN